MFAGSVDSNVVIDEPKVYYTNGDFIRGHVCVRNQKPRTVQKIKIRSKCEEVASVNVNTGNGKQDRVEKKVHLSLESVIFPAPNLPDQEYTLQEGDHIFQFKSQIPKEDVYPQSYKLPAKSGIYWFVEGLIEAPSIVISRRKRRIVYIEMRPNTPHTGYDPAPKHIEEESKTMYVYLPHSEVPENPIAKLKSLLPSTDPGRRSTTVKVRIITPRQGSLQAKHPSNIGIDIVSENDLDPKSSVIKHFACWLKQIFHVSVEQGYHTDAYRQNSELMTVNNISWGLKEGQDKSNNLLSRAGIVNRIPPTRLQGKVRCHYKLCVDLVVASRERPNTVTSIVMEFPVEVSSFVASEDPFSRPPPSDPAPSYYPDDEKSHKIDEFFDKT